MIPYGKRKSRAAQTTILNNQIYSAEGGPPSCQTANTSFDIDVPNGDVAMITGNTIVQGPSAQNHKMVVYGGEGLPYANNSATFATNTFISTANSLAIEDLSYLDEPLASRWSSRPTTRSLALARSFIRPSARQAQRRLHRHPRRRHRRRQERRPADAPASPSPRVKDGKGPIR